MKLAIIVNKRFLVIPDSALANIVQMNPVFSYEGVPGKLLFPISIPYMENAELLGLPSEAAIIDQPIKMDCHLLVLDTWLLDGTLIITKSNGENIEVSVACPYYDLSEELFNKNIRDLAFEDVLISDPEPRVYVDILFSLIGSEGDDTITVNTGYAEYTYSKSAAEVLSVFVSIMADLINADTELSGISAEPIGGDTLRLRQDELGTLNYVFVTELIGVLSATYTVTIDYMTWLTNWHDDLASYLDTTMGSGLLYPDTPIQWPTYKNTEHYGDLNPDFTGWVNNYEQGKPWINYSSSESMTGNKYTLVPMFFLLKVLEQIFSEAKITVSGPGVEEERFKRILVDNNHSIGREWYDPISDTEYVSFSAKIVAANHLPDMTVGEFMNAYRAKFNYYYSYNPESRTLDIKWRGDVIENPIRHDWNNKPYLKNPVDEFIIVDGLTLSSPLDTSDDFAGIYPAFNDDNRLQQQDYVIGNGQQIISSAFTHPSMQIIADRPELGPVAKVPVKSTPGSGDEWQIRRNSFAPALLIYVGSAGVYDYNFATTDQLDVDGEPLGLNISLMWDELYTLFYQLWIEFAMNASKRRVVFALSITDLMQLNFSAFYGHNNKDWLIESWEISDIIDSTVFVEFLIQRRKNYFT